MTPVACVTCRMKSSQRWNTVLEIEKRAYGCYGFVTTFNQESETCQLCPLKNGCAAKAYQALKNMSAEIDVTSFMGRFGTLVEKDKDPIRVGHRKPQSKRQKLKQYTQSRNSVMLAINLPYKERKVIASIERKGLPVRSLIRGGFNPFENQRPAFMKVPCRLLIEFGRFTRPELKQALMAYFPSWKESTAESHATIAVHVLVALKVIQKTDDIYLKVD